MIDVNSRAYRDGELAHANEIEQSSNPYRNSDERLAKEWDAGWLVHARAHQNLHGYGSKTDALTNVSWRADTDSRAYRDGQLAHANELDRSENPFRDSDEEMSRQWNAGWDAHRKVREQRNRAIGQESLDTNPLWHAVLFVGLVAIFFPWSLLLLLLVFGWDGTVQLLRQFVVMTLGIALWVFWILLAIVVSIVVLSAVIALGGA
ncbi:MAG: hypothetical protein R3E82_23240 [Pseudomonadales bacterium]